MSSIVLELQSYCLNEDFLLSELLRKAYFIAVKLNISDFKDWAKNELNGYADMGEVPQYRFAYCELKAFNPYHGWIPLNFPDADTEKLVKEIKISQSIYEIEELMKASSTSVQYKMPNDMKAY